MAKRQHKFAKAMLDSGMPQAAVDALIDSYVDKHFTGVQELRICPDPFVQGAFAVRIVEKNTCYSKLHLAVLLVTEHDGVENIKFKDSIED